MNQEPIDWDFKALNPTDYELELQMKAKGKMMDLVFAKARKKLKKKTGKEIDEGMNKINSFEVPPEYYNFLKNIALRPVIKHCVTLLKADKIVILENLIKSALYVRKGENWEIKIVLTGLYADKR